MTDCPIEPAVFLSIPADLFEKCQQSGGTFDDGT
jgi:hypothetical protein